MNFKIRLKAALQAFREPGIVQNPLSQKIVARSDAEPGVVFDNRLLAGKNVLITGAGQNIGRSIALEMAKQGANIYFAEIDSERCKSLEQELKEYNIKYKGFVIDVSIPESIDRWCELLVKDEIVIDILANNVGIHDRTTEITKLDLENFKNVFNTNVFCPLYLTKRISQKMLDRKIQGSILFITSIHQETIRRVMGYSASKAALGMLVKELAIDLAKHKIRVNGIAPGWVSEDKEGNTFTHQYTPLYNSSINPRYIGRAAVYLASDYFSRFTTGTVIKIDAGLSLYNYLVELDRVRRS